MSEEPTEKPKLIIDDDWKERVQSEKEAAAAAAKATAADSSTASDEAPDAEGPDAGATDAKTPDVETPKTAAQTGDDHDEQHPSRELPPASFATLVHSLTAQALSSLGQIPDPDGKINVDIGIGKHFIDTLAVLEEKTKGNLDADESTALAKMLYELRMLFVHVRKEQQAPTTPPSEAAEDG